MLSLLFKTSLCALTAFVLGAGSLQAGAVPAKTVDVKTGMTTLYFNGQFVEALRMADVLVGKVAPGKVNILKGQVAFPITGGAVDTNTAQSEILHSGGFSLVSGGATVSFTDFVAVAPSPNSEDSPTLSALVTINGVFRGRIPVLTLGFPDSGIATPIAIPKNKMLILSNVELKLASQGALLLNQALGVAMFSTDTVVGIGVTKMISVKGAL